MPKLCVTPGTGRRIASRARRAALAGKGELKRVLPGWYGDAGEISLYYASRTLLLPKTRVFIDFLYEAFEREGELARRLAGSLD